jgi:excisionase family DNA binding protein
MRGGDNHVNHRAQSLTFRKFAGPPRRSETTKKVAMADQILTIPEVAERLRLSEARIRQLIAAGTLPSAQIVKPKGRHLIHSKDVERLLEPTR